MTRVLTIAALAFALIGCADRRAATNSTPPAENAEKGEGKPIDEVAAERAKLSPEDRALVEAQEWCVVSDDERLGSMGPPLKLEVKGQPVFVCCKGCKKRAQSDPDRTLAKLAELKAKAKGGS